MKDIIFKTLMLKGEAGSTIVSMEKTGHAGTIDTYTITYDDGSTTDIYITNLSSVDAVELTSQTDTEDTYTVTLSDGSTQSFSVKNHNADIEAISEELAAGLASIQAALDDQSALLNARMDTFTSLPSGSTAGDAELTDIRVAADGTLYPSAGTAVRKQISDVNSEINMLYEPSKNLYNPALDRHGKYINESGEVYDSANYKISDYIFIGQGNSFTIPCITAQSTIGAITISFYGSNSESSFVRRIYVTTNPQTITMGSGENYIVIGMYEVSDPYMVNRGSTLLPYSEFGSGQAGEFLQNLLDGVALQIGNINSRFNYINLFNKETISENKYINPATGGIISGSGFFASDFIDVSKYETIKVSKTHLFALYKADKSYLSAPSTTDSINSVLSVDVSDASYIRFSTYNQYLDAAQIGENISASEYIPYGKYTMDDLIINDDQIVVDANGGGDYTSFTQAVYETVDSGKNILVKAGTYNIVSEYVALFGQSAVNNMADADSSTFNGFQYGIILRKRKVEFAAGSHLVCDWSGHTVDGTHRFSALRVDYNVEIIGLDLDCTHTFYAIHDDYGLSNDPYTVKYKNCRIVGHSLHNGNCIGGGCKKYSRHIIENCYFNNNTSDVTLRYHNTNAANAEPEVYISNSFFNDAVNFNYYGSQESKMRAYVNNCKAKNIAKTQESSSFNIDNVELYKWCCEETT